MVDSSTKFDARLLCGILALPQSCQLIVFTPTVDDLYRKPAKSTSGLLIRSQVNSGRGRDGGYMTASSSSALARKPAPPRLCHCSAPPDLRFVRRDGRDSVYIETGQGVEVESRREAEHTGTARTAASAIVPVCHVHLPLSLCPRGPRHHLCLTSWIRDLVRFSCLLNDTERGRGGA